MRQAIKVMSRKTPQAEDFSFLKISVTRPPMLKRGLKRSAMYFGEGASRARMQCVSLFRCKTSKVAINNSKTYFYLKSNQLLTPVCTEVLLK